ncbi:MAG: electron transfer flavoprotein subunit alpha/FixB family protein [Candidatus Limnocylindrales bacterium]
MAGAIWVVGEAAADGLARISAEVATLGRALGAAAGRDVVGIVAGVTPGAAAAGLAAYLPRVLEVEVPAAAATTAVAASAPAIAALAARDDPAWILLGASPDGRDLAGTLAVLLDRGVLVNASAVSWDGHGPLVEASVFGGRLIVSSGFSGDRGIVTVRPNSVVAEAAASAGIVEKTIAPATASLPEVMVVERVQASASAVSIDEARIVVSGGRGVGGPDGFRVVEDLAAALGGVVGATRAAVDAGWIPYSQQIGQTGKIVKPELYLALGISGAIQHKVGMQTAATIVAVNRDPDAPIAEFADLVVIGDLFEIAPAIAREVRARSS